MDTIPPQPTVMVTGSDCHDLRSVAMALFDERATGADGAVVVTTRESPRSLVRRLTGGSDGFERDRIAVVDVRDAPEASVDPADVGRVVRLDPGVDPETVDEAVTGGLEWLADAGVERRHFLYDVLASEASEGSEDERSECSGVPATEARLPDEAAAYDRAYRVAMSVGSEEGLALFTLDDGGLSPDLVERLGHLFDVHVELRGVDGVTELRWTGLLGASEDWVDLADADLGVGGFR